MDRADFGVIGFGRFGRLVARHLATRGEVLVWDIRADCTEDFPVAVAATTPSVRATSISDTCRSRVVLFAVPIGRLPEALARCRDHLHPGTLVADTCSVKVWPCRWMLDLLPAHAEILGTHPLFGPDSAIDGLRGHKIVVVPLRVRHPRAVERFLESMGLIVLERTAEAHDRQMAETQSLVHWLGRALERSGAGPRELDTLGYRRLLDILSQVTRDSWELFADLQRWNPYAAEARGRFLSILKELDRKIGDNDVPDAGPPPTPGTIEEDPIGG